MINEGYTLEDFQNLRSIIDPYVSADYECKRKGRWYFNNKDFCWFTQFVSGALTMDNKTGWLCKTTRYKLDRVWWDAHPDVECWCDPCCLCSFYPNWTFDLNTIETCVESNPTRFSMLFLYSYYRSWSSWQYRSRVLYEGQECMPRLLEPPRWAQRPHQLVEWYSSYVWSLRTFHSSIQLPNLLWAMVWDNPDDVFLDDFTHALRGLSTERVNRKGHVHRVLHRSVRSATFESQTLLQYCLTHQKYHKATQLLRWGYQPSRDEKVLWIHVCRQRVFSLRQIYAYLMVAKRSSHLQRCRAKGCQGCLKYGRVPRWWWNRDIKTASRMTTTHKQLTTTYHDQPRFNLRRHQAVE